MGNTKANTGVEWFDVSNYECLNELTVGEFCHELYTRIFILRIIDDPQNEIMAHYASWIPVLNGDVVLDYAFAPAPTTTIKLTDDDCLCQASEKTELGVVPLTKQHFDGISEYINKAQFKLNLPVVENVKSIYDNICEQCQHKLKISAKADSRKSKHQAISMGIFCEPCATNLVKKHKAIIKPIEQITTCSCEKSKASFVDFNYYFNKKGNVLRVDLESFTNEELLQHFSFQIEKMRDHFNVPEPTANKHRKLIKDALKYKLIPVFDLLIQDKQPLIFNGITGLSGCELTHEKLSQLVFNEDDAGRDRDWVRKELKEYRKRMLAPFAIEQVLADIKSKPSILKMKVCDL